MSPVPTGSPCPRCGKPITTSSRAGLVMCGACGFIPGISSVSTGAETTAAAGSAALPRIRPRPELIYKGALSPRTRSLYESGWASLERGDLSAAVDHFEDALALAPDFVDVHLILAQLIADDARKREHLSAVIAVDPANAEALRLWMIVNGELTPEQAARVNSDQTPQVREADAPVETQTQALLCPVCGGHLTIDDAQGGVRCRFCGHQAPAAERREIGARALGMALIARKAQPERWIIGERLLHCRQCGAERTIPATVLSMTCPFCGSNQVIEQDAVGSFVQPDGLVPFELDERDAVEAIKRALKTPGERLAGMFDDNRVKRGLIDGVFAPFWVFDVTVELRRLYLPERDEVSLGVQTYRPPHEERFTDAVFNLEIPALKTLAPALTGRVSDFRYDRVRPYEPALLARYPASLYDVDFDHASLQARSLANQQMREKHRTSYDGSRVKSVTSAVQSMTFSLYLLPIFVCTLMERDGDTRPAWVNGVTGAVTLGRARKSR